MKTFKELKDKQLRFLKIKWLLDNIHWRHIENIFCQHCSFGKNGDNSCNARPMIQNHEKCAEGLFDLFLHLKEKLGNITKIQFV